MDRLPEIDASDPCNTLYNMAVDLMKDIFSAMSDGATEPSEEMVILRALYLVWRYPEKVRSVF